ncbi:hypothetical protein Pmi06nite_68890 [Planotetraspora mira]|uniref:Uncharacterized protein n=1 Tax=Planotetraspora mira TaxID=58121 RepID=A0A8J3TY25_9ACTN|nr:hypothetical protein Pmi06nite_68890 [Planotetraspora mira]
MEVSDGELIPSRAKGCRSSAMASSASAPSARRPRLGARAESAKCQLGRRHEAEQRIPDANRGMQRHRAARTVPQRQVTKAHWTRGVRRKELPPLLNTCTDHISAVELDWFSETEMFVTVPDVP